MEGAIWHQLEVAEAAERLAARLDTGLDPADAAARLAREGPNELAEPPGHSLLRLLLDQLRDVLIAVLLAVAVVVFAAVEVEKALMRRGRLYAAGAGAARAAP